MATDWRQGSVFRAEDAGAVLDASVDHRPVPSVDEAADRLMVLTQDCDLSHRRAEEEPWAEILPIRTLGEFDRSKHNPLLYGKNPRRLVFQIPDGDSALWWWVEPHSRFRIRREGLGRWSPDPTRSLPVATSQTLARWISRRYTRAALADAFNARLGSVSRKLDEIWKSRESEAVSGLYVLGAREERSPGEPYNIKLLLTVPRTSGQIAAPLASAHRVSEMLDAVLAECPGIEVEDLRVDPEQDITLADLRTYQRLDLDYRSGENRALAARPVDAED